MTAVAFGVGVVQSVLGVPAQLTNGIALSSAPAVRETLAPSLNVKVPHTTPAAAVGP
jgi:hypothetical protein